MSKQREALEAALKDANDPHANGLQKTTIALIEAALAEPDYEALYEQVCEQYNTLAKFVENKKAEPEQENFESWYFPRGVTEAMTEMNQDGSYVDSKTNLAWCAWKAAIESCKQEPVDVHADDIAVDKFAAAMRLKMEMQRTKGYSGWDNTTECPTERLQRLLVDHIAKGDPVDVGNFAMMLWNRGERTKAALAEPEQEPDAWEGGEGWESLAWQLCADENGEDACNQLIWEGGPVPEPWGDRWIKYEGEAKRLIALVKKHTSPQPREWKELTEGDFYYLQDSRGTIGNCPLWWAKNGMGYTTDLRKAHKYTLEEAMQQHRSRETDIPWACAEINPIQRPTVDCQDLYKIRGNVEQIAALRAKNEVKV